MLYNVVVVMFLRVRVRVVRFIVLALLFSIARALDGSLDEGALRAGHDSRVPSMKDLVKPGCAPTRIEGAGARALAWWSALFA